MAHRFSWHYSRTALMSIWSLYQSFPFAFYAERDRNQWKLGWDLKLLAGAYTGIFSSGVAFSIVSWCVMNKGPMFVAIFNPLMLALTVLAGSILPDETVYIGSIIGMVLIVSGLYIVLWGKSKEASEEHSRATSPSESMHSRATSPPESIQITCPTDSSQTSSPTN
ncbi:hypothetical protein QN277_009736 [Acacia crassicarpa]|nr:hypothetical protein QN277_009736 [Acacia crassicarpa]